MANTQLSRWFTPIVSLLIITTITTVSAWRLFSVAQLNCQTDLGADCPQEIYDQLTVLNSSPLFFIDYNQRLRSKQSNLAPFKIVSAKKKLPDTLEITVRIEKPIYVLTDGTREYVVSESGLVFPFSSDSQNLPKVTVGSQLHILDNSVAAPFHQTLSTVVHLAEQQQLPITSIHYESTHRIVLDLTDQDEQILLQSQDIDQQLQRLILIRRSISYNEHPEVKEILDLRFNLPVLRTRP